MLEMEKGGEGGHGGGGEEGVGGTRTKIYG